MQEQHLEGDININNEPQEIRVELCLTEQPALTPSLQKNILQNLQRALHACGDIALSKLSPKAGRYSAGLIATPGGLPPGENGQPGVSITFGDAPTAQDDQSTLQCLSQTWQWDDAAEAVAEAPFRITVRSVASLDLPVEQRVTMMQKSLHALVGLLKPAALLFPQSQCCIEPESCLENDPAGEDFFPLYGLVNARIFTADEEEEDRRVFMDTLGLHVLGLPDVQCLISNPGTDFAEMAYWLYNMAEYMRENPGSFEDGDIILGLEDEEWELAHTTALIEPERSILNINTQPAEPQDEQLLPEQP